MFSRVRRGAVSWLLRATCLVALSACGVDKYEFVDEDAGPGEGGASSGVVIPIECTADEDCAGLPATSICDPASGYCVECLPDRESELDRCPAGLYCDDYDRCAIGCDADADCAALSCDRDQHLCVGCLEDADCSLGTRCENAACIPGCSGGEACPGGWLCCSGECKNPLTDAGHCGECEAACTAGGECLNGLCGSPRCFGGTAECDGDPTTACETDVYSDPSNCGRCHVTCASGFCSGGKCTSVECPTGFADCNNEEEDRCETDLSTIDDCGACGVRCSEVNGEASCADGACAIVCDEGYDDCDDDVATGCETRLATDAGHCGSCGNDCTNEHGSARCVDGECSPRCDGGFADCDGDPSNGCETDIRSSVSHCGACGERCAPPHAEGVCEDGLCRPACDEGFDDCNGDLEDGCEADLSSPETCGDCSKRCVDNGGTPVCTPEGTCRIICDDGRADCTNDIDDGCETNVAVNVDHCGRCETSCPATVGQPVCDDGRCGVSTCSEPFHECDSSNPLVCETDVTSSVEHCGGCGRPCFFPNGSGVCRDSQCTVTACDPGFADCGGELGCETVLGRLDGPCRNCQEICRQVNGRNDCTSTGCQPDCAFGFGNCDGDPDNGCETPVDTLTDCGECDEPCSFANATASCPNAMCTFVGCLPNFGNCDGNPENGCELALGSDTHCSACNNRCTNDHGQNHCAPSGSSFDCSPSCTSGWADCDGNPDNGCETSLDSTSDCGACGRTCSGGTPYCRNRACTATPPGLCTSGTFALCDDFEDDNANGWTTTGGTWTLASDPSFVYVGGLGSYRATTGTTSWTNQTVQSRVKVLHFDSATSSYRAGIVARYGGSTDYYTLQIDGAGDLRLLRGTSTVSGTGTCATIANSLAVGTWYTLKLQASGPANAARLQSSFSTNGTTFTAAHDCTITSGTLDAGSAGVISVGGNTNAEFDDFAVTTP